MVILLKNVGTDIVQSCLSPRGILILMSVHQVFDHAIPDGHLIFECGTDHGCLI